MTRGGVAERDPFEGERPMRQRAVEEGEAPPSFLALKLILYLAKMSVVELLVESVDVWRCALIATTFWLLRQPTKPTIEHIQETGSRLQNEEKPMEF